MKYIMIPYVSLGLVLSLSLGIDYHCVGQESFPQYYGSPFVFKQKSLGSSMQYFYSVSGVILNVFVWSIILLLINKLITDFTKNKILSISYKIIISLMIAFTTLNIIVDSMMLGRGFEKGRNYWYWNIDKEAQQWGMTCKGKMIIFRK